MILFQKKIINASLFACLAFIPDLDIFFNIHRSASHSVVIIFMFFIPFFLINWYWKLKRTSDLILSIISIASHPIFDMLSGYTPVLWPIFDRSVMIIAQLKFEIDSTYKIGFELKMNIMPTVFNNITEFKATILTGPQLIMIISIMIYLSLKIKKKINVSRAG